jgi:uncharacterized lipoprotein YmbA
VNARTTEQRMTSRRSRRTTAALVCFGVLASSGCFALARSSPPIRYYVLGATAPAPTAGALTVGLRRADVAAYLGNPGIVVRRGENEVAASEFHRWSEPLDEAINRVVAVRLAAQPPVRAVDVAPWSPRARHNLVVQLHVIRFEGVSDAAGASGRVHLDAGWDIVYPLDGRVLIRGHTVAREGTWTVGDYNALVGALDATLATLASDIGGCLAGFRNDSTPPASCGSGSATGSRGGN